MKIRSVGAEFFHADGRTDKTKQIVAFRNFAKEPKNIRIYGMNWIGSHLKRTGSNLR